jgi:carboxyl-terminal processing protease
VFREDDLRRHLINEVKADDPILLEDSKDDPRFSATPEELEKKGIEDYQLFYAVNTIARLGGPTAVAAAKPKPPAPKTVATSTDKKR